jgi:membrane fusion protein, multidrug efflux system
MIEITYKNMIILAGLALMVSACEKPAEPLPPPRPALVIEVGETAQGLGMVLVGEVKSRYESQLGFRIGGKVIARKVEVGDMVKKGQVLAQLDAADTNLSVAAAAADVRAAEANHALAKAELDRQRQLYEKKFIAKSALDIREAEFKTASARLSQVKSQAAVSGNQTRYNNLIADRAGVITQVHAEPGQVVAAGEIVAQIMDTNAIEVQVAVPESRMANIKLQDTVTVKLWAEQAKDYIGKVREIAPAANSATRAFDVRVAITNPDDKVRLGMTAGVEFATGTDNQLIIPDTAITQINGVNSVWVISKEGIANPRTVQIGPFSELGVLVTSGLQAGEMVAIAGVHTLIKGQQVKPQIETAP